MIRSKADNVSLNKSIQADHCRGISTVEPLNQQEEEERAKHDDYINLNEQAIVRSIKMKNDIQMVTEDDDDDDGHHSDQSNSSSDDFRFVCLFIITRNLSSFSVLVKSISITFGFLMLEHFFIIRSSR